MEKWSVPYALGYGLGGAGLGALGGGLGRYLLGSREDPERLKKALRAALVTGGLGGGAGLAYGGLKDFLTGEYGQLMLAGLQRVAEQS